MLLTLLALNKNAEWITPCETKGPCSPATHLLHQPESVAEVHPEPELMALIIIIVGRLLFYFSNMRKLFENPWSSVALVPQLKCAGWEEMPILMWAFFFFEDGPSAYLTRCLQVLRCAVDFLMCRELKSLLSETIDVTTRYLMWRQIITFLYYVYRLWRLKWFGKISGTQSCFFFNRNI